MPRYYVVTPSYESGGDWYDPPETGSDVVVVDAPTKRAAIHQGVLEMLRSAGRMYRWCRDQRSQGCNPWAGVKALPYEEEEG